MKHARVFVLMSLFGAATIASAADSGFYFGLSGGEARYDFEPMPRLIETPPPLPSGVVLSDFLGRFGEATFRQPAIPVVGSISITPMVRFSAPETFWLPSEDDEATAWSLLAGYRIFRFAALELTYTNLGTLHRYQPPLTFLSSIVIPSLRSEMESQGGTLSALGILPITDQWNMYLRAGGLFADQEVNHNGGGGPTQTESFDSESWLYGIGTAVDFGTHWTVRVDFQRYDDVGRGNGIGEADVDLMSLGVLFRL